jgi:hypothetical protein
MATLIYGRGKCSDILVAVITMLLFAELLNKPESCYHKFYMGDAFSISIVHGTTKARCKKGR